MWLRLVILVVVVGGVAGGLYYLDVLKQEKQGQRFAGGMPPAKVSVATVETRQWAERIQSTGSIIAVDGVMVTTEVEGQIATLDFTSSTFVEKGTVLITLEAERERADLSILKVEAAEAERQLKLRQKLSQQKHVSASDLQRALSERNLAKAKVKAQTVRLEQKIIRAPFSGWLGIRQVNPGQYLDIGDAIVSIQSIDPLLINFRVPDRYLPVLKKGQPMMLRSDVYPGEVFGAEVAAVENVIDPGTRSLHALGLVPNPTGKLRPGLFAEIEIAIPGDSAVQVIPRTAIKYQPYGNSVFVVAPKVSEDGAAQADDAPLVVRQRFIKTGEARGDFVAITEGLNAGDQVVTSGLLKLRNDMPVVIDNSLALDPKEQPEASDS